MVKLIAYRMPPDAHPALVERMRELYIASLQFFTKPLSPPTKEEQQVWWASLDHSKVIVHLYSPVEQPWEIVAFSMLTDRGQYYTPLFAISDSWWHKGYGEDIIRHYLALASPKPLHGEELADNGAIVHLNEKAGWRVVAERNGVHYLYHPNDKQQEAYDEIVRYHES